MRLEEWQVPMESPGHFSAYSNNPHGEDNQNYLHFPMKMGLPGSSDGKESAYNMGDLGSIPSSGKSLGREDPLEWLPTPVFLPGKSRGQRSLAGHSPRGCRVGRDRVTTLPLFFTHQGTKVPSLRR